MIESRDLAQIQSQVLILDFRFRKLSRPGLPRSTVRKINELSHNRLLVHVIGRQVRTYIRFVRWIIGHFLSLVIIWSGCILTFINFFYYPPKWSNRCFIYQIFRHRETNKNLFQTFLWFLLRCTMNFYIGLSWGNAVDKTKGVGIF